MELRIWILSDGKRGHLNQSLGLAEALARRTPAAITTIELGDGFRKGSGRIRRQWKKDGPPHLILAAGHRTHWNLLYARWKTRARTVVLMKPSLPRRCFDLCLIPEHDSPDDKAPSTARTLLTTGALNRVRPQEGKRESLGLILVGGPSREYRFKPRPLMEAIRSILATDRENRPEGWVTANSRRTPPGFLDQLRGEVPETEVMEVEEASPNWLPEQIARASEIWVTADSASMVYESLSSGARVGILPMERSQGQEKLGRGLAKLEERGWVTRWETWTETGQLKSPPEPLAEADRCARWIIEKWFPKG